MDAERAQKVEKILNNLITLSRRADCPDVTLHAELERARDTLARGEEWGKYRIQELIPRIHAWKPNAAATLTTLLATP